MNKFDEVEDSLYDAKAIAWDTCHKIYVLMDDEQVALMRQYEYDPIITASEQTPSQMLETIKEWYEQSCGLRFVSAVETNISDPNAGFTDLIPQGYEEDCEDCGERGCYGVCNDNCQDCGEQPAYCECVQDDDEDDDED